MQKILFLISVIVFFSACPGFGNEEVEEVQTVPTFDNDIKPIFDRLCNECHGVDRSQGANLPIRYDLCEDSIEKGVTLEGAKSKAQRADARSKSKNPMPPLDYAEQPTPEDKARIAKWVAEGAPCNESEVKTSSTNQ